MMSRGWTMSGLGAVVLATLLPTGCGIDKDVHQAALDKNALAEKRIAELDAEAKALEAARAEEQKKIDAALQQGQAAASDLGQRVAHLRRQEEARASRLAMLRRFSQGVTAALAEKGVQMRIRHGRLVVHLPEGVLFDSGKPDLKADGKKVLDRLAPLIMDTGDRTFRVAGHTDNVPIKNKKFPSNWELSTARATEVVQYLAGHGVDPKKLAAAGRADNEPVGDNNTPEGRAENRRIELVIEPDLSELPDLAEALRPGAGS